MDENSTGPHAGSDDGFVTAVSGTGPSGAGGFSGEPAGRYPRFLRELPFLAAIALVLSVLLKTFLVQPFYIPSESMENTLRIGDRILVNKVVYHLREIRRGDIVVFDGADSLAPTVQADPAAGGLKETLRDLAGWFGVAPRGERDFVKRVIGVGGDRVICCDDSGRITVNGVALDEPYLHPNDVPSADRFDVRVPGGKLWVMGDHRALSEDSRAHLGKPGGGFVPADRVIGRAMLVMWPLNRASTLPRPAADSHSASPSAHGSRTSRHRG